MADLYSMITGGFQAAQDGAQRGKQTKLAGLLGQAYSVPREQRQAIIGQVAAVDPQSAYDAESHFGKMDENARAELGQYAAAFLALPPEQKAQAYPDFARKAQAIGIPAPLNYSPEYDKGLQQVAQAFGGAGQQGIPAQQQYAQWLLSQVPEGDRAQALGVLAGTKARPATGGFGFEMIRGADGLERMGRKNPRSGAFEVYNEETGDFDPIGSPGLLNGGQQQSMGGGDPFAFLSGAGATVTSGLRSPQDNQRVDGVTNSYHLTGQARDILPPSNPQQAAMIRQQAAANGLEVIDEGDHWHLEPRGNAPRNGAARIAVGRRPEDEAAAKTAAEERTRLDFLRERGGIEAENAALTAAAKTTAEEQAKFLAELPKTVGKADEALSVIDKALNHPGREISTGLSGTIDPRAYLPGGAAADFQSVLEQLQGRAFLEAFESLKGGGQITEVEGNKATAAMARLKTTQSDEGFRQSLQDLRDVVSAARDRAIQKAASGPRPQGAPRGNAIPVNDTSDDDLIGKYL